MSPITTHVLDTSLGRPAEGIEVTLAMLETGGDPPPRGSGVTDADGRVTDLLSPGDLRAGRYRLTFETAAYFADSDRETFYPRVEITFEVVEPDQHYHVPLLLSSHGYTTYRGS